VEEKLAQMLASNPLRMNYEKKYQEIIAAYNQDKDRATVEDTFARLMDLANSLDEEQRRAVELGLTEEQLALFDLLGKESLSGAEREKIKQESRDLLAELQRLIAPLEQWTEKEQTQAEVEVFILDHVFQALPEPPYTAEDKKEVAELVYRHIWQQSASGLFGSPYKATEAP
jgi:type I restriction enzyme R subunit